MSKKYRNPISQPNTVTIPVWEYKALVTANTLTTVAMKLVNGLEEYKLRDTLDVLFRVKDDGEEE